MDPLPAIKDQDSIVHGLFHSYDPLLVRQPKHPSPPQRSLVAKRRTSSSQIEISHSVFLVGREYLHDERSLTTFAPMVPAKAPIGPTLTHEQPGSDTN